MYEKLFPYSIVDVFTRKRFNGNPVAVIHDARGLDSIHMQSIAREFGFSETTFILPPNGAEVTAQVRIFTPYEEIPFAGHPNIGTSFVMATHDTAARAPFSEALLLDELGGQVRVRLIREGAHVVGAEIEAPQPLQRLGEVDPKLIARCLGLASIDVVTDRMAPCVASVGLAFAFVEVHSLGALAAITPGIVSFQQAANSGPRTVDGFSICAFVVLEEKPNSVVIRSRVFSPLGHPPEDPATGSASGALAALLAEASNSGEMIYTITQGVEMGRPSQIEVEVGARGSSPLIRGYCVAMSSGNLIVEVKCP